MSTLQFFGLEEPDFGPLSLELGAGISVLVSDEPRLGRLAEILAGVQPARRGRVLLGEDDVFTSRETRAGLYSVLPREVLPAGVLEHVLTEILSWKGSPDSARTLLGAAGLMHYASCDTTELEPDELRAVMLALALGAASPSALVLSDPFALAPWIDSSFIERRCRTQAARCPVLILSPSVMDSVRVGGSLHVLGGRQFIAARELIERTGSYVVLSVCAERIRELAAALSERVWVSQVSPGSGSDGGTAVETDAGRTVESDSVHAVEAGTLIVQGDDLAVLARAVTEAALRVGAELRCVQPLGRVPTTGVPGGAG